ncbi:MAG TPA: M6 family metalloprotease domain-containing protein [Bacteroidia bacterium]|nr:M6 family metalloprotease domain-containing protein [Bacteroidia bacterium]
MRKFLFFIFCMFTFHAFAAPYWGEIQKFKQPDGTWVEVRLFGDEFYIRAEGLDGYTLIRDEKTNWICYAELAAAGTKLLSTGIHYNGVEANPASLRTDLQLPKHIEMNKEAVDLIRSANNKQLNGNQPLNRFQNKSEEAAAPPQGKVKGLAIIVDFSDEPGTLQMADFEAFLNGDNYSAYGNKGSVKEYFSDISGGMLEYENIVYGWYRAPKTFAAYDAMPYAAGAQEILGLALNWIKSKGFDFSTLTINNGKIRAINLMYTGNPPTWSKGMWHHMGQYTKFSANGVTSGDYNCSPAGAPLGLRVVCHENGHMVGEWPDTYKYDSNSGTDGIGAFDLMCNPGEATNPVWPNPYFLSRNGFGQTIDVTTTGANVNDPTNSMIFYKYSNKANPAEYFIIHSKKKALRGSGFPDEGVTIWRVNTAGDNQTTKHEISLVHAGNNKDQHTTACYKPGKQEYTDNTTPNAKWLNGTTSGLRVWDWGTVGTTIIKSVIRLPVFLLMI